MGFNFKNFREKTGLSRKEFSEILEIPYRTVEDWENGKSNPAKYLVKLIIKDMFNRKYISANDVAEFFNELD